MRFGSVLEWVLAAALTALALAAGSVVIREFRTVRAVMPVIAGDSTGDAADAAMTDTPPGVPPRSVSVPMLQLSDGKNVRLGEPESVVVARLGADAEAGAESIDRSANRVRITRFYSYIGTQFVLVFEPFGQHADLRVAAIYLP